MCMHVHRNYLCQELPVRNYLYGNYLYSNYLYVKRGLRRLERRLLG